MNTIIGSAVTGHITITGGETISDYYKSMNIHHADLQYISNRRRGPLYFYFENGEVRLEYYYSDIFTHPSCIFSNVPADVLNHIYNHVSCLILRIDITNEMLRSVNPQTSRYTTQSAFELILSIIHRDIPATKSMTLLAKLLVYFCKGS